MSLVQNLRAVVISDNTFCPGLKIWVGQLHRYSAEVKCATIGSQPRLSPCKVLRAFALKTLHKLLAGSAPHDCIDHTSSDIRVGSIAFKLPYNKHPQLARCWAAPPSEPDDLALSYSPSKGATFTGSWFPVGFEPTTDRISVDCSTNELWNKVMKTGIEPATSAYTAALYH
jgi:hypothetical protein